MRICLACHDGLACENQHTRIILRAPGAGEPCGICAGDITEVDCFCAAAREIESFNRAVRSLALAMRRKFIENMDKGGWAEIDWGFGVKRLNHEVGELAEACMPAIKGPSDWQAIVDESADVANFAVFLATRAMTEDARNTSLAKQGNEAWVKMRISMGDCCNIAGPCERQLGLATDGYCEVCKAKLTKKETQKLEAK